MKKLLLSLFFILSVFFVNAQTNLLVNPGFETWTAGAPDGWTLGTATFATATESTSIFNDGAKSFKVTAAATAGGTYIVSQIVPITAGKTYTVKMSYYIETGDGTDARIWSDWCNVGTTTTYAALSHADSVLLMGPGGGSAYFPDVKGVWKDYTCEVTAPATGYNSFSFQFRTYKTPAVVYWDKMFFGEKTTGLSTPTYTLDVKLIGNRLEVLNSTTNEIKIYNTTGLLVKRAILNNCSVDLSELKHGIYIVKSGDLVRKFEM